jgi:hypothetical protein
MKQLFFIFFLFGYLGSPFFLAAKKSASVPLTRDLSRVQYIAIAANDTIYYIGPDVHEYGGNIYKWTVNGFEQIGGLAKKIEIDPEGNPWVINSHGDIYRMVNERWVLWPGLAEHIGFGQNGSIFCIGPIENIYGGKIYEWTGYGWLEKGGSAMRVDVDAAGTPFVVNREFKSFFWSTVTNWWELWVSVNYKDPENIMITADITNDGNMDSVFYIRTMGIWYRDGVNNMWTKISTTEGIKAMAAGDVNNDGKMDLAIYSSNMNNAIWIRMGGTGNWRMFNLD